MRRDIVKRSAVLATALAMGAAAFLGPQAFAGQPAPTAAVLQASAFAKGPDPTEQSIRAQRGTFAVSTLAVPSVPGRAFNRGTIHYPTDTSQGTFGAVVVSPGFFGPEFSIAWYGATLASHGFVVLTLDTNWLFDQPDARGDQLLAAADWLAAQSPAKDRVDPDRLAVMGHSMGGGGSLIAASKNPALKAAIPLTPWNPNPDFSAVTVPTLILGTDNDTIAPAARHADRMYASLQDKPDQAYLKLKGDHFTPNFYSPTLTKFAVTWLKRYVDDDTRYSRFLCPTPAADTDILSFQLRCPV
ncbi:poly(ethylene terephthalate) hydrolase family protein [Actinokineospora pegani]|uniref:poly(ethylene terephthalate) hydrolase family protein n=1 Tax=Actinokineospora pegani TaxID=2654637 RepID=UPI001F276480|nr:dienelactone hydrolase family protein [Actinokineospora pegani]